MKIKKWNLSICMAAMVVGLGVASCSDNVDEGNLYSFSGRQISESLSEREDCRLFAGLLQRVHPSSRSESTLYQLLSARGNYTVFAPTDKAIRQFTDSVTGHSGSSTDELADSTVNELVRGCIIDCGSDDAYRTIDLNEGVIGKTNMNDRYMTVAFDTTQAGTQAIFVINSTATIIEGDIECENGYVNVMNRVPTTSNSDLPSLLRAASNMRIFSRLLAETGWDRQMLDYLDADYEENHPDNGRPTHPESESPYPCPAHRRYGYTAFVEPDSIYMAQWGVPAPRVNSTGQIENWDAILAVIKERCADIDLYENTSDNLRSEDNAVNQFVAYHLLPASITYNKLVVHFCEAGFSFRNMNKLTLNLDEFYTTMGKRRRLMKITEGATTDGKRINRYSSYDAETYDETTVYDAGALIAGDNGRQTNYALNGFYYPIDRILVYDSHTRDRVLNQRLRFDVVTLFPEMLTYGMRRPDYAIYYNLPANFLDPDEMSRSDETEFIYKATWTPQWYDYDGDEMLGLDQYDFTFRLPPVPADGTYELRIGVSATDYRSMAQVYIGDNKDNLPAIGLPIDMRVKGTSSEIGWVKDGEDAEANNIVDQNMRHHGYMKAPNIYGFPSTTGVTALMRNVNSNLLRKILTTMDMKAGKKYYCRFKSVLSDPDAQFFFDYIELVPKSVYNNPNTAEDKW